MAEELEKWKLSMMAKEQFWQDQSINKRIKTKESEIGECERVLQC